MRVAAYMRVSTAGQAREGVSLETQEQLARDRCGALGWTLAAVYTDVMSGRKDDRPELKRMLTDAHAGRIDAVMVYRLDRLGRSLVRTLQVVGELADAGVRLISLTQPFEIDGSLGKLMLSIYASFAEMESEAIGARVRDARRQKVQMDGVHGAVAPYGYRKEAGALVIVDEHAAHVRWLFEQAASGRSLRGLAADLNERGVCTAQGGLWNINGIRQVLTNETYKGCVTHGKKLKLRNSKGVIRTEFAAPGSYLVVKGSHEAIVETAVWEAAQEGINARRGMAPATAGAYARVPWFGVARCGLCGGAITTVKTRGYTQLICAFKHKTSGKGCSMPGVALGILSGAVVREMASRLAPGVKDSARRKPKATRPRASREKEIARLEAAIQRESDLYRIGAQNLATTEARVGALRQQLATLAATAEAAPVEPPRFDNLIDLWRNLDDEGRAATARTLVEKVAIGVDDFVVTWRPEFRDYLGEGFTVERPRLLGGAVAAFRL